MIGAPAALLAAVLLGASAVFFPPAAHSNDPQLLRALDSYIESERARSGIPGVAVALVRDGRIAVVRAYGTRGEGEPLAVTTPLPIGSLTKSFTAVLVRQLIDAGRLDLDAPVQRVLQWFTLADAQAAQRITVRHLLNHTSGLSRADGMRAMLNAGDASIESLARSVAALMPSASPGERFQYSNLNYVLLGAIVQSVEGKPWAELVQQRIFEPLQMRDSATAPALAAAPSAVHRYMFGVPVESQLSIPAGLAPTGGLVASAEDMARYLVMLLQTGRASHGAVLSPSATAEMLAPASPPGTSHLLGTDFHFRYGEGWFVGPFGAWDDARWHLGNLASFAAWMVVHPDRRQGVVVLINANSELPFFGASSTFSRIAIGVVNLMQELPAPEGPTVKGAYAKLNLVLASITVVAAALSMLALRGRTLRWQAPLALLGLALTGGPVVTGLGWAGWLAFAPDVAVSLLLVVLILLAPTLWTLVRRLSTVASTRNADDAGA